MSRSILAIVVFAFALASSGLHKLAYQTPHSNYEIVSVEQSIEVIIEHCCDSEEEGSDIDKPRCLADNCLFAMADIGSHDGHLQKIGWIWNVSLETTSLNQFLRPPIV